MPFVQELGSKIHAENTEPGANQVQRRMRIRMEEDEDGGGRWLCLDSSCSHRRG